MSCPTCNGTGKRQYIDVYGNPQDIWLTCELCNGKGYLTNNEWRKTCSEEDFVNWIVGACHLAVLESTYDVALLRKKKYWERWLKEMHKK